MNELNERLGLKKVNPNLASDKPTTLNFFIKMIALLKGGRRSFASQSLTKCSHRYDKTQILPFILPTLFKIDQPIKKKKIAWLSEERESEKVRSEA